MARGPNGAPHARPIPWILRERPRRWPLGLQAALGIAGPILIGTALGRAEIGFQAALGAFALLYFGGAKHVDRARTVPLSGAILLACAAAGAASGASPVTTGIGLIVVATVAGLATQVFDVGPPGPIFFVLVFGSSAHITLAVDGVRHVEPGAFVAAVAGGVALASLIAATPLVLPLVTSAGGMAGSTVAPERVIDTLVGATLGVAATVIRMPARSE